MVSSRIPHASPNREYLTLAGAFDFFNRKLFAGTLPAVLITLQRHKGARGYYSAKRFIGRAEAERTTDEIALNPAAFEGRSDRDIFSTLVHEMVHLWQHMAGTPSQRTYHNREWAQKMEVLGLMPSATGVPGGRKMGQHMTHYIVIDGPFDRACGELLAGGARLLWQSLEPDPVSRARKNRSKTKYTCPACGLNAWAKAGVCLKCGDCDEELLPEEP